MKTAIVTNNKNGQRLEINIRCDDQCKNGHDTFSITGSIYEKGARTFTDRTLESCGCIHDRILDARPELKPFIDLHLSDGNGAPMYAVENGYYYYSAQYPEKNNWFKTFCEHLRISETEGEKLVSELDKIEENDKRKELFIKYVDEQRPRWKQEAEKAKELLQKLISEQS